MSIRIGYLLPTRERVMAGQPQAAPLLELAERAERLGFDSIWAGAPAIADLKAGLADFRRPWPSSVSRMAADKTQPLELPQLRRAELKPAARVNGTCYDRRSGRNPAGRNAGGVPSPYHFDVLLGERHPLLAAEQLQQDKHPLGPSHPRIQT
jgi:hypothetical protein